MTRHTFLGDLASWVLDTGAIEEATDGLSGLHALAIPSVVVTMWDALTAGTQYTDLEDINGNPITQVSADSHGELPQISGPDGVTQMYADAAGGSGPRRLCVATDTAGSLNSYLSLAGGTLSGAVAPSVTALTSAATIAVDATQGNDFRLNMTVAGTLENPTGMVDGQVVRFHIIANSHALTWGTAFDFGNAGAPTLSGSGKTDLITGVYNDGLGKWLMTAALGF